MELLDGRRIASKIFENLKVRALKLRSQGIQPGLAAFNIGQHEPSLVFLKIKEKRAHESDVDFHLTNLPPDADKKDIIGIIQKANQSKVSAITFQLPLPNHLISSQDEILNVIHSQKDVDLLTSENKSLLEQGKPRFMPPTAAGILKLLSEYNIDPSAHQVLIIGQGELVGKPLSIIFRNLGLEFMSADKNTKNLQDLISSATLIITATGAPGLIKSSDLRQGVILVDAGTAESGGKLVGDVDPSSVQKAKYLTPIPGGVGPMTVAMLYNNVIEAAEKYGRKS